MNYFAFIPFTAALVNLGLSIFVLSRNPGKSLNRVYFFWGCSLSLWNIGTYFSFLSTTSEEGVFWVRVLQFGVIGLPFLLFHLCKLVGEFPYKKALICNYLIYGIFLVSNFTDLFVADARYVPELQAYYAVGGPFFWVFTVVYTLLTTVTILLLKRKQKTSTPLQIMRYKSLLVASVLLFVFGSNDLLPILGIAHYPFTKIPIFPVGSAAAIFYGVIVCYSVLQHQLLDVQVALGRAAAKLVRAAFLTIFGFVILLAASICAPAGSMSAYSFSVAALVLVSTGIFATFFFPRIFGKGADRIERRILGDYFEYQDRMLGFIQAVPWYTNVNMLLTDLEVVLNKVMSVDGHTILLMEYVEKRLSHLQVKPGEIPQGLPIKSPLYSLLEQSTKDYHLIDRSAKYGGHSMQEDLAQIHIPKAAICFPMYSDQEPFGCIVIGEKNHAEPFTNTDIQLLVELSKSLSLVINQIRLKGQIQMEQELDLLGRMSRGLAHDLNNLLTPVWTLLQVSSVTGSGDEEMDDLVHTATRNVQTMRNYIRDSLFFSRTMKPQMASGVIDEIVRNAINVVQPAAREKSISLEFNPAGTVYGILDMVLFQRLAANLLSNAVDASKPGMLIRIELEALPRKESGKDWIRLKVIDHGEGISPENLERMKAAFFTTKDSGDGRRGFGLGLAICRKIVHLHNGTLNISSQFGKGTTVQVDLPSGILPEPVLALQLEIASA